MGSGSGCPDAFEETAYQLTACPPALRSLGGEENASGFREECNEVVPDNWASLLNHVELPCDHPVRSWVLDGLWFVVDVVVDGNKCVPRQG